MVKETHCDQVLSYIPPKVPPVAIHLFCAITSEEEQLVGFLHFFFFPLKAKLSL